MRVCVFRSYQSFNMSSHTPDVFVLYTSVSMNPPFFNTADSLSALSVQSHEEPQTEEEEEEEEDDEDQAPGCVALLEIVKGSLLGIVNKCITKYLKEKCEGCAQNYPSQRHHTCMFGAPKHFIITYYEELVQQLWTPRLVPTVVEILQKHGMKVKESRVRGMMEMILYELRKLEYVDTIEDIIEALVGLGNYKLELASEPMSDFVFRRASIDEVDHGLDQGDLLQTG